MTEAGDITRSESAIGEWVGRRNCILTGNGTSALKIAFSLIPAEKPKILVPAMACMNPLLAVYFAGKIPAFVDVLESDATLDPVAVKKALEVDPEIGAVLVVHLYGHPARTREIVDICRQHGAMVIDDPAQAMGGRHPDGALLGTLGDMAVVSFGHTKILDVGGGGALLTDNDDLAEKARRATRELPGPSPKADLLSAAYSRLYYAIWDAVRSDGRFYPLFDSFPALFEELFVHHALESDAAKIPAALERIDAAVSQRKQMAAFYREQLQGLPGVTFFDPIETGVPWRFTFRLDSAVRASVLEKLRAAGFDISSWYPCFVGWTPEGRKQGGAATFPVADMLEKEVVNLWAAEGYDREKAGAMCQVLRDSIIDSIGKRNADTVN